MRNELVRWFGVGGLTVVLGSAVLAAQGSGKGKPGPGDVPAIVDFNDFGTDRIRSDFPPTRQVKP